MTVPSRLPIVQAPMAGGPSTAGAVNAAGDPDVLNLWAGTGWQAVTTQPARKVVRRLAAQG